MTDSSDEAKTQFDVLGKRLERSKLALEVRLKRRELLRLGHGTWRESLASPLFLAVVGGLITVLTAVLTNYFSATAAREADERKAKQSREAESRGLQSELIKTFLKAPDPKIARDNLIFLIESGLIPDHEERIAKYLASGARVPRLADARERVPQQFSLEEREIASRVSRLIASVEKLADKRDDRAVLSPANLNETRVLLRQFAQSPGFQSLDPAFSSKSTLEVAALARSRSIDPRFMTQLDAVITNLKGIDAWASTRLSPSSPPSAKELAGYVNRDFLLPRWAAMEFPYVDCPADFPFC